MNILCPVCKEELTIINNSYKCINNHNFDISKEGYINLYLKKAQNSGDEKEMINARNSFLSNDYYSFLRDELNDILVTNKVTTLLDLGCGEGYYTMFFDVKEKIGIDLSKSGLKIASKKDKNTTYVLSSIFNVPIKDNSMDAVLTCFAPIAKQEIIRVLKNNGIFILVRPNVKHLCELREVVYDNPYDNVNENIEIDGLKKVNEYSISSSASLNKDELKALFTMTPYYHTTSSRDKEKLNSINELSLTFDFIISIYKKY